MTEDGTPSFYFGLVCEGPADARTVKPLLRRVYEAEIDWLRGRFDEFVGWTGVKPHHDFTKWSGSDGVHELAKQRNITAFGDFTGQEGRAEALQAKKALRLFISETLRREENFELLVVVLIRDTDGNTSCRAGMEQARKDSNTNFEIVLGLPHPMRECWVLTGLSAEDDEDREHLEDLRRELGFDPTEEAHRLTARTRTAKKNPHRVVERLIDESGPAKTERENRAISNLSIDPATHSGEKTGLKDFLEDILTRIPAELDDTQNHRG